MKEIKRQFLTLAIITISTVGYTQVFNDECITATALGNVADYCSNDTDLDNNGATASADAVPFCWFGGSQADIWYTFVPTATAVYINLDGSLANAGLVNPSIVVYEGTCSTLNELACNSIGTGTSVADLTLVDLTIGQIYYLRIDGENGSKGPFRLCINSFFPVPSPESDCPDAVVLCDKSPFQIANLNSAGNIQNELTGPCVDVSQNQNTESASVWYTWTCKDPGTLTFTLTPNNVNSLDEDLDFVVYELPGGLSDCNNRVALRCMLSGRTSNVNSDPCFGPTGLMEGETDISETAGCSTGDNNFVAPLDMVAGVSYALIVNNFSESGFGFGIEFGGTGTFEGPEPDFDITAVQAFECDKTVIFDDLSTSATDAIVSWTWNFGVGATPISASGPGPHDVIYESFGDKVVALTVESSRGCLVTKVLDIFVEACCDDFSQLDISATTSDFGCFGQTGQIFTEGSLGFPQYNFSLDGIDFIPNTTFNNLPAGDYLIYIQDIKGCIDSTFVSITEPPEVTVEAGDDQEVDLGFGTDIDADHQNGIGMVTYMWSPPEGLSCTDCPDPDVIPQGSTTYTVTVTDENGCTATDQLIITTNIIRPFYAPNVFSPNRDGSNDFFNLFAGPAASGMEELTIFDRWGNIMFDSRSVILSDPNDGWNGRFNGELLQPNVYTWLAKIRWLDNVVIDYSGTVTLVK